MMKYQPLELGLMQQCGSSLLRAIQNESMVPLDLLVREAIQNSLDAAAPESKSVDVEFLIREHSAATIAALLGPEGAVGTTLVSRYKGVNRMIEIRDRNTNGLTGPLRLNDLIVNQAHGNLLKLVYEVGRSQEREDTGGSWGYGKTVYFRIGVGLVFYYSRIRELHGHYSERLAACLVEDETSGHKLQTDTLTGVAWWGAGNAGPVTDTATIGKILESLGVKRFSGTETGTSIVVPFIKSDLRPVIRESASDEDAESAGGAHAPQPWWCKSDAEYIRVAIQRWYGLRLGNRRFPGPFLRAAVDGENLSPTTMLPAFRVAQALFNRVHHVGEAHSDILSELDGTKALTLQQVAPIKAVLDGAVSVGTVAIARLNRRQLGMEPPDNHASPFAALYGDESAPPFAPIVGFVRQHGMIIRWDQRTDARGWARGFVPSDDYVMALFVPASHKQLHGSLLTKLKRRSGNLDAYLRGCEKADHYQWTDPVGFTVVERIKARVAEKMRGFSEIGTAPAVQSDPVLAAREVADRLLPSGFGTDGRNGVAPGVGKPPAPGAPKRSSLPQFEVLQVNYGGPSMTIRWRLSWARAPKPCVLRLLVDSESGPALSREKWTKDGMAVFPLAIQSASVGKPARLGGKREQISGVFACHVSGDASELDITPASVPLGAVFVEGEVKVAATQFQGRAVHPVLAVGAAASSKQGTK